MVETVITIATGKYIVTCVTKKQIDNSSRFKFGLSY